MTADDEIQPGSSGAQLDAQGRERPAFVLEFPSDPELDQLVKQFESGNFAAVRRLAPELAARTHDPEVRVAALELRERTRPDRTVVLMLALSIALLSFVALWAYWSR